MSVLSVARPSSPFNPDHFDDDIVPDPGLPRGFEFVDGQLQELHVSQMSSYIAGKCYLKLSLHVEPRNLGWVFPEGTSYQCFPDDPTRVRRADTAFHRLDRLTTTHVMEEGHSSIVPDLVVEVVSPHDIADAVNRKWREWLRAGALLVWVVHPLDRTIHAYTSPRGVRLFTETDILTAEPVLPEFQLPMTELFQLPAASPSVN